MIKLDIIPYKYNGKIKFNIFDKSTEMSQIDCKLRLNYLINL